MVLLADRVTRVRFAAAQSGTVDSATVTASSPWPPVMA